MKYLAPTPPPGYSRYWWEIAYEDACESLPEPQEPTEADIIHQYECTQERLQGGQSCA